MSWLLVITSQVAAQRVIQVLKKVFYNKGG